MFVSICCLTATIFAGKVLLGVGGAVAASTVCSRSSSDFRGTTSKNNDVLTENMINFINNCTEENINVL